MWGEIGKLVGGAVAALLVSLVGIRVQQGAKHRRVRKDLFEELELLRVLKEQDRDPDIIRRVQERLEELESEYTVELMFWPYRRGDRALVAYFPAGGAVAGVLARWLFDLTWPWWVAALVGAAAGVVLFAMILAWIVVTDWLSDQWSDRVVDDPDIPLNEPE